MEGIDGPSRGEAAEVVASVITAVYEEAALYVGMDTTRAIFETGIKVA